MFSEGKGCLKSNLKGISLVFKMRVCFTSLAMTNSLQEPVLVVARSLKRRSNLDLSVSKIRYLMSNLDKIEGICGIGVG